MQVKPWRFSFESEFRTIAELTDCLADESWQVEAAKGIAGIERRVDEGE
jgi:hypothetical protein